VTLRTEPLGRLTHRPLPDDDPTIDALSDRARQAVAHQWTRRVVTEGRAIDGFERLAAGLASIGADPQVVALALRASDDERRHTELCRKVAERYLGRPLPQAPPPLLVVPEYEGAPPALQPTLLAVALCCLQETSSSTFIEACLKEASAPLARAALRELFTDEIDHARIGWAHLGSTALEGAARAALAPWLTPLARANFNRWWPAESGDGELDAELLAHGCGSRRLGARAALASTRDLIAPGLLHLGFVLPELQAWVASLPPTPA
jgi:hypothetical protein